MDLTICIWTLIGYANGTIFLRQYKIIADTIRLYKSKNSDCYINSDIRSKLIKRREVGRVGQVSLLCQNQSSYSCQIPQQGSVTCAERGIFPNTSHNYGLRSGSRIMAWRPKHVACKGYLIQPRNQVQGYKRYLVLVLLQAYSFNSRIRTEIFKPLSIARTFIGNPLSDYFDFSRYTVFFFFK